MSLFYHFDTNHSCNNNKKEKTSYAQCENCNVMSTPVDHYYLKLSRKFKLSQPWVAGFCIYLKNDWHIYPNFCNISGNLCLWSDSLQNCSFLRIKFLSLKSKENLAQAHYITLSLTEDLVTSVGEQEQWNHQLKKNINLK